MDPDRSQQVKRIVGDGLEVEPAKGASDRFGIYETVGTLVRRPRVAVAAALVLMLAVLGALAIAQRQAHLASLERANAVQRFQHARELAQSVLVDHGDGSATLPDSTGVRRRLVQDALKYLDSLTKEAAGDRALLGELADAYEKIAAAQAGTTWSGSVNMRPARNPGDTAGAIASQEKAITLREELVAISRNDPAESEALANGYTTLAGCYLFSGSPQQAVDYLQKALPIAESLLASKAASESVRRLSCTVYLGLAQTWVSPGGSGAGDTRSALAYARGALKMRERLAADFPGNIEHRLALAQTYSALALIYAAIGEHEEQVAQNRKALAIARALVASQPGDAFYRGELAVQLANVGNALVQLNDKAAALEHFREAFRIYDELIAAGANDVGIRTEWALAHRNVGVALGAANAAEALQHFEKAVATLGEITANDPNNSDAREKRAFTHLTQSRLRLEIDDPAAAVTSALEGIRIGEELAASSPENTTAQNTLALLFTQLGASHAKWATAPNERQAGRHWQNARQAYSRAREIYDGLKANGKLSGADAKKPDELAAEIAKCDAALQ